MIAPLLVDSSSTRLLQNSYSLISRQLLSSQLIFNLTSVADPGCLSRILIFTHPGSRIPDPKQQQKRGVKKTSVILFL
jgi:hypothetical protein